MSIYLDHNATAPLRPEYLEFLNEWGNGSAVHSRGRRTRALLEAARGDVAACLGVPHRGVIFTGSATEANNMIVRGYPGTVIASLLEHPSTLKARPDAHLVPLLPSGVIDLDALEEMLGQHDKPLVSLMAAHNETGVIQPVEEAAKLTHQYGGLFHTDVVQAYGRIPLPYEVFDYITLSAHKLGGLTGVGALYAHADAPLHGGLMGGGQEYGVRAGTENLPGIRSMAYVMKAAKSDPWDIIATWRNAMEAELSQIPGTVMVVPHGVPRLPNTLLVAYPGVKSETLVMRLDLAGFEVSSGSACHSGKVRTAGTLEAMGISSHIRESVVRVSLPYNVQEKDVQAFVDAWRQITSSLSRLNT